MSVSFAQGAKAILDLPLTLEYLETFGVPVIGYQSDELAAFYSVSSGLKIDAAMKRWKRNRSSDSC